MGESGSAVGLTIWTSATKFCRGLKNRFVWPGHGKVNRASAPCSATPEVGYLSLIVGIGPEQLGQSCPAGDLAEQNLYACGPRRVVRSYRCKRGLSRTSDEEAHWSWRCGCSGDDPGTGGARGHLLNAPAGVPAQVSRGSLGLGGGWLSGFPPNATLDLFHTKNAQGLRSVGRQGPPAPTRGGSTTISSTARIRPKSPPRLTRQPTKERNPILTNPLAESRAQ
jgi:hypothetical protein